MTMNQMRKRLLKTIRLCTVKTNYLPHQCRMKKVQIKGDAEIEGPVAYGSEGKTYCQRFNVEKTIPNSLDWK
jgi:hypothetical protein